MFDPLRERSRIRLIEAGIAPRRAHRILQEFCEHHADVAAEQRDSGASAAEAEAAATLRVGSLQQLVANVLERPDLRSWTRRRPWFAFAVAPLLSFVLSFAASLLVLIALVEWHKAHGDTLNPDTPVIRWISEWASAYLLWGLPFATAGALALIAARRREISLWPCVGIVATCFVGALTNFSIDLAPGVATSQMGAGIGISTDHMGGVFMRAGSTAALALLSYLWIRHRQRRDCDALN